jgi:hypothetical protein
LPDIEQIVSQQIQAGDETLYSENHKLIKSIRNKTEFLQQWKEFIIVPIYTKADKIDDSNYQI